MYNRNTRIRCASITLVVFSTSYLFVTLYHNHQKNNNNNNGGRGRMNSQEKRRLTTTESSLTSLSLSPSNNYSNLIQIQEEESQRQRRLTARQRRQNQQQQDHRSLQQQQQNDMMTTSMIPDLKGKEWPSYVYKQEPSYNCNPQSIPMSTMCEYEWEMNNGPESNYNADYFKWQKDVGVTTGVEESKMWRWKFPNMKNKVVADIGCGGGFAITEIKEASKRYCFEINPYAIAAHPKNVISVSKWSQISDDMIDNMFSAHSFEHHPHPLLSLQCAVSKLKPGTGIIHLEVPFEHSGCSLGDPENNYGRYYYRPNPSFHIYTWNPRILGQFLHAAGLVDIECIDLRGQDPKSYTDSQYYSQSIWCYGRRDYH